MTNRSTETNVTPAALVSHTMIRIQGNQDGDIEVYHACSPNARLRMQRGGMLMTMLSAQAIQGVLEGFNAARSRIHATRRQNQRHTRRLLAVPMASEQPCAQR